MGLIARVKQYFRKYPEETEEQRVLINRLREHLRGPLSPDLRKDIEGLIVEHCKEYGRPVPYLGDWYRD